MTPILLVCGPAGSGKDTVAEYLGRYLKTTNIAQADPMKRFARDVFGFSELQLWGPSEERNKPDERYGHWRAWTAAREHMMDIAPAIAEMVLPNASEIQRGSAVRSMHRWFDEMRDAHFEPGASTVATPTKILTPRYMLQTVGTEWGRKVAPNMWNDLAVTNSFKLLGGGYSYTRDHGLINLDRERAQPHQTLRAETSGPEMAVITDGRFRNEVLGVQRAGGRVLLVRGPAAPEVEGGVKGHVSEAELAGVPIHWYDFILFNDKTQGLLALENKVASLARTLKRDGLVSF